MVVHSRQRNEGTSVVGIQPRRVLKGLLRHGRVGIREFDESAQRKRVSVFRFNPQSLLQQFLGGIILPVPKRGESFVIQLSSSLRREDLSDRNRAVCFGGRRRTTREAQLERRLLEIHTDQIAGFGILRFGDNFVLAFRDVVHFEGAIGLRVGRRYGDRCLGFVEFNVYPGEWLSVRTQDFAL